VRKAAGGEEGAPSASAVGVAVAVLSLGKREGAAASWKPEELLGPGRRAEHRGADGEGRGPGCFEVAWVD
jgi:hypothetical protein